MSIIARPSTDSVIDGLGHGNLLPESENVVDFEISRDEKLMQSNRSALSFQFDDESDEQKSLKTSETIEEESKSADAKLLIIENKHDLIEIREGQE